MGYYFGTLNDYAIRANLNSKAHGFWDYPDGTPRELIIAQKLALIHSEVSEALEALRGVDNLEEELADICIRVFDLAESQGFNLEQAIVNKMQHNESRPHMHGKGF